MVVAHSLWTVSTANVLSTKVWFGNCSSWYYFAVVGCVLECYRLIPALVSFGSLVGHTFSSFDTFYRHVAKLPEGDSLIIGLAITVGALPAVIFLVFAEKIVDYCGHSNILIFCFVNYICHHLSK